MRAFVEILGLKLVNWWLLWKLIVGSLIAKLLILPHLSHPNIRDPILSSCLTHFLKLILGLLLFFHA
jgi:hypothetical protein